MQENDIALVSVIIPVYNVENYIRKCVESVLEQTYSNIEIICVNDGSPDCSRDIIAEMAEKDSRIKIIDIENSGLSMARNTGMAAATGKYIYFLDSDDYLELNAIELLVNCAEENALDILFFSATPFFESKEVEEKNKGYRDYYTRKMTYEGVYNGENLFIELVNNWDFKPSACMVFTNRQFLKDIGLKFYPGILHEDNLFTMRLMQRAKRAMVIKQALYRRLVREASIVSGEKGIKYAYGFFVCQREILSYLGECKYSYDYYKALEKHLANMKRHALNAVKNASYESIVEKMMEIDAAATGYFLEYVKRTFRVGESGISSTSLRSRIKSKIKRVGRKCLELVSQKLKWLTKSLKKLRPGYFVYCKMLKLQKNKICVSIIMPVYNAAKYLEQTLDSLMKQTLKNIEIICVDDGSTDDSMEILKKYSLEDSRIRVLSQQNTGAGAARNYGLSVAQGEYLLFLDADDIFDKDMCNQVYYKSLKKKADVCLFGAQRYNMQTRETEPMNWVLQPKMIPMKDPFAGEELNDKLFQITTGCPWSKMFRRDFVLKTGIQFQNLQNANDTYFVRTHMALAERITTVNEKYVTYRYNSGTNIQANKSKAPFAFYEAFRAIKEELIKRGVYEIFEQTYCNMVLKESLFNMKTTGDEETKGRIKNLLLTEAFEYFGVAEHSEEYYYNKQEYEEMRELLRES